MLLEPEDVAAGKGGCPRKRRRHRAGRGRTPRSWLRPDQRTFRQGRFSCQPGKIGGWGNLCPACQRVLLRGRAFYFPLFVSGWGCQRPPRTHHDSLRGSPPAPKRRTSSATKTPMPTPSARPSRTPPTRPPWASPATWPRVAATPTPASTPSSRASTSRCPFISATSPRAFATSW
jgi:hypothetical protein